MLRARRTLGAIIALVVAIIALAGPGAAHTTQGADVEARVDDRALAARTDPDEARTTSAPTSRELVVLGVAVAASGAALLAGVHSRRFPDPATPYGRSHRAGRESRRRTSRQ